MADDTTRLKDILEDPNVPPKGRLELADESKFKNGQKPDETNFIQLFKSFINKVDDEIIVDDAKNIGIGKSEDAVLDAKLHIDGTLKVEESAHIEGKLEVGGKITANSLQFEQGTEVNEISNSDRMGGPGPSENSLSTQYAIKNYVDYKFANEVEPIAQGLLDKFLIGCIVPFAREKIDEPPEGWLFCDGGSYNAQERPELQNLFDVIGQHYGSGDGSDSGFSVPDLRGVFIRGMDKGGLKGLDPDRGNQTDMDLGSYQEDALITHKHYYDYSYSTLEVSAFEDIFAFLKDITLVGWLQNEVFRNYLNTSYTGSTETRPKNAIYMYCIKY